MVGHGGSSAGSYLADPTSPIPSHCASIVVTSTLRVNAQDMPTNYGPNHLSNCNLVSKVHSLILTQHRDKVHGIQLQYHLNG